jgi:hypothetical protein
LAGLETMVAARQAIVKSLQEQIDRAKKSDLESAEAARPYFKAMRDLEVQQKLRDSIFIRILQEKVDSNLQ